MLLQREHQQSEVCEICLWHLAGDGVRWTDLRTTHHSDNCLTLLNAPSVWTAPLVSSRGRQFKAFKVSMHKLPVKDRGRKGFRCLTPASGAAKLRERQLRSCFPARWLLIATCALPASKPQAVPQHAHTWLLYAELLHRCRCRTGLPFQACDVPILRRVPVRDFGALKASSFRKGKHPAEKNLRASLPGPVVHDLCTLQEAALCEVRPHVGGPGCEHVEAETERESTVPLQLQEYMRRRRWQDAG